MVSLHKYTKKSKTKDTVLLLLEKEQKKDSSILTRNLLKIRQKMGLVMPIMMILEKLLKNTFQEP